MWYSLLIPEKNFFPERMKNYLAIAFLFFFSASYAQTINTNWKQDLNKELTQLRSCENSVSSGVSPCNMFMGNALHTVYNIDDFYSKELGRHMVVSEISGYLKNSAQWKSIGYAYDQKALKEAQRLANAKIAVVAIYLNQEGIGHVSIIVPGELRPSGTWGFPVPNSASLFPGQPEKSYVDKALSYSFEKSHLKEVLLYARNY